MNDNKDKWRFWCDDNGNGIWDDGEKYVEDAPMKSDFDTNEVSNESGALNVTKKSLNRCV